MTSSAAESVVSLQELRNATEQLERAALASGGVTEQALDTRRPGGSDYPDHSAGAWLAYHGWLAMQVGRPAKPRAGRALPQILHEALAETPAPVTLRSGQRVHVYAKSLDTLMFLEALDADLQSVLDQLHELLAAESEAWDDPINRMLHETRARFLGTLNQRLALRLFVWTLTTEGAGLPFSEHEVDPAPPDWTAQLHVEDIEALFRAHVQVNRDDLEFLVAAFPSDREASRTRLPLSGFLGAMAHEWGLSSREVMRQFTVRGLFAQAITAAQTHREARATSDAHAGRH